MRQLALKICDFSHSTQLCISRNVILLISLSFGLMLVLLARAEDVNKVVYPGIYDSVKMIIEANEKYSDDVECMTKYLIDNDIVQSFHTPGLTRSPEKLKRELEPYLPDAKESCGEGWFKKAVNLVTSCFMGSSDD